MEAKKIRTIKITFDEKVTWTQAEKLLDFICEELDWMNLTAVPELTEEFLFIKEEDTDEQT